MVVPLGYCRSRCWNLNAYYSYKCQPVGNLYLHLYHQKCVVWLGEKKKKSKGFGVWSCGFGIGSWLCDLLGPSLAECHLIPRSLLAHLQLWVINHPYLMSYWKGRYAPWCVARARCCQCPHPEGRGSGGEHASFTRLLLSLASLRTSSFPVIE